MTSRRRFLRGVGAALGVGLGASIAGCGYRPGGGDIRWRADFRTGFYGDDPVGVADGVLYGVTESARTFDFESERWVARSSVVAHDAADGSERFEREFDPEVTAHAIGDGGLAVAFADGALARLTGDGVQWRASVDGEVRALAAAAGRIYAATADGRLVAVAEGSRVWAVDLPVTEAESGTGTGTPAESEAERDRRPGPVVAAGANHVLAATGDGVAGFAPDGRRLWTRRDLEVPETAVFTGGRVHVWRDLHLTALDPATGRPRWTLRGPVRSVALTGDGGFRVGGGELVAFDGDGERRWSRGTDGGYDARYGDNVAADSEAVYATRDGDLVAHDPADGSVRWAVDATVGHGPYLVDSGVLVVGDGELVCHYRSDQF